MNATIKKIGHGLLAALMLMSVLLPLLGAGRTVHAAESQVAFTLHKIEQNADEQIQNTGHDLGLTGRTPVVGAKFKVFNVTDAFYQLLETHDKETAAAMMSQNLGNYANLQDPNAPEITTGQDGLAVFNQLPAKTGGRHSVYAFSETWTPQPYQKAADMIVSLPVRDKNGNDLTNIHLYPKDSVVTKHLDAINGGAVAAKDLHDVAVGDVLTYNIQFQIPHDIGAMADNQSGVFKYNQFEVLDYMTKAGLTFKELTAVTVDGQNILNDLTGKIALMTSNDAAWQTAHGNYPFGFKLDFLGGSDANAVRNLLTKYAGKRVTVGYTGIVNEKMVPDQKIGNTAVVSFDPDTKITVNGPEIQTGGMKFFKYETGSDDKSLAGAKFIIQRQTGNATEYAVLEGVTGMTGAYAPSKITWTTTKADATELTTNAGKPFNLSIQGMLPGTYTLIETDAPDGYEITDPTTDFEIVAGTWGEKIVRITNTPVRTLLPMTGGMGLLAFLLIGIVLMSGGYYVKKQTGKKA
ncbi:MAG: SpaH/EbpB family LPXTG-anchored major pilin [Lacticaseibacillus paracasei]